MNFKRLMLIGPICAVAIGLQTQSPSLANETSSSAFYGFGTQSCGKVLDASLSDQNHFVAWLGGFFSGLNTGGSDVDLLGQLNLDDA